MKREIIVRWKIKEGHVEQVLSLLPSLGQKSIQEEGNLFYTVYQKEDDPTELTLHEGYLDEVAMNAHKESEHYQTIVVDQIIPLLEIREVQFVQQIV